MGRMVGMALLAVPSSLCGAFMISLGAAERTSSRHNLKSSSQVP